jgi:hypothetical protein
MIAIFVGIVYCAIGLSFGLLAGSGGSSRATFAWRLAAWVASAAVYAAHLAYEQFRLRNGSLSSALHAATAVAVGAFGLAVAATVHRALLPAPNPHFQLYALALVAWPVVTALPAFVVTLVATAVLARIRRLT